MNKSKKNKKIKNLHDPKIETRGGGSAGLECPKGFISVYYMIQYVLYYRVYGRVSKRFSKIEIFSERMRASTRVPTRTIRIHE